MSRKTSATARVPRGRTWRCQAAAPAPRRSRAACRLATRSVMQSCSASGSCRSGPGTGRPGDRLSTSCLVVAPEKIGVQEVVAQIWAADMRSSTRKARIACTMFRTHGLHKHGGWSLGALDPRGNSRRDAAEARVVLRVVTNIRVFGSLPPHAMRRAPRSPRSGVGTVYSLWYPRVCRGGNFPGCRRRCRPSPDGGRARRPGSADTLAGLFRRIGQRHDRRSSGLGEFLRGPRQSGRRHDQRASQHGPATSTWSAAAAETPAVALANHGTAGRA